MQPFSDTSFKQLRLRHQPHTPRPEPTHHDGSSRSYYRNVQTSLHIVLPSLHPRSVCSNDHSAPAMGIGIARQSSAHVQRAETTSSNETRISGELGGWIHGRRCSKSAKFTVWVTRLNWWWLEKLFEGLQSTSTAMSHVRERKRDVSNSRAAEQTCFESRQAIDSIVTAVRSFSKSTHRNVFARTFVGRGGILCKCTFPWPLALTHRPR